MSSLCEFESFLHPLRCIHANRFRYFSQRCWEVNAFLKMMEKLLYFYRENTAKNITSQYLGVFYDVQGSASVRGDSSLE